MNDDIVKPSQNNTSAPAPQPVQKVMSDVIKTPPKPQQLNPESTQNTKTPPNQTAPEASAPAPQPSQAVMAPKPQSKHVIWPIIIAVIILLALSSIAIYAGLISKDDALTSTTNNTSTNQSNSQQSDTQDVDEAVTEIDNLRYEDDVSEDTLSDQALGL